MDFTVKFSEPVTGVDTVGPTFSDFSLTTKDISNASVSGVTDTGSGDTYTVTVNTGTINTGKPSGTIRLNVVDNNTIHSVADGSKELNGGFTTGEAYTIERTPPYIVSAVRADPDPTGASNVNFTVTFSEFVTGVDISNFDLMSLEISGMSITTVSGSGKVYTVTANTGIGDGSLQLIVLDDDTIVDYAGNALGGIGYSIFPGETYTVDKAPFVLSSARANPDPTGAPSIDFTVTFSGAVIGVDISDFALVTTGISGATVSGVTGSGATRTVTVNTGNGNGTIHLNVLDNDSIKDVNNQPLNGGFTGGETYTINKTVETYIGGSLVGSYTLNPSQSTRVTYALDSGPVKVASANGVPIIAALRDAWLVNGQVTSSAQLMGLPKEQLSDTYLFPAYNNITLSEQIRFANVDTVATTVTVKIGGLVRGNYLLNPNENARVTYNLDTGPVEVKSSGGKKIIAAIRDAWLVNGQVTSFTQIMGLPKESLSDTYLFPAYNNVTLSGQLRIGNVDTVATTVTVTIAGVVQDTYPLNPSAGLRVTYPLDAGPVEVKSSGGVKIIAALRDAWLINGQVTSFAQLMGLPKEALSDTYLFPAYNNVTLSGQLRFANVDIAATTVTVKVGGAVQGTYPLSPGASARVTYPLDAGPVEIKSSGGTKIIAALRDAWLVSGVVTSFTQMMGLPDTQLSDTYWFPAYNNITLSGQLRFGVP